MGEAENTELKLIVSNETDIEKFDIIRNSLYSCFYIYLGIFINL